MGRTCQQKTLWYHHNGPSTLSKNSLGKAMIGSLHDTLSEQAVQLQH